ncbi:hypothetical protein RN001_014201 [Aquatica leii]|uniref:Uncharacterized protein n=1 Tax=Aquatica leii TaxID=1421715 RepID=A0AAN7P3X6_9COLE|nr:hypothetical protein RN001_014201 [Aquatica leii]
MEPIILVHGGAGDVPASKVALKLSGCKKAVIEGFKLMKNGGTALDAVEAAVRIMEDEPVFNAGYGSALNIEGEVEMDASVMIGNDLRAGSVSIVKDIAHPISLARKVMEKTPHVILSGEGGKKFALEQGFQILDKGALVTEDAKTDLKYGGHFSELKGNHKKGDVGTVGAVAIDASGMMVAGTSTGGICGKMVGRCSDTSQIGSGTYANKYGVVSTTGYGEEILKFCLAHTIIKEMENGKSAQEATTKSIKAMTEQLHKTAGAITLSKGGNIGIDFSSKSMSWAYITKKQLHYGIEHEQDEIESLI